MSRVAVDGLVLETAVRVPRLPPGGGRPDWTVEVRRGALGDTAEGVVWTGHVRHGGRRWCRHGRRGDSVLVLVDGWFDLEAVPAARTAVLRHAHGTREDARVLRRALPYLAALAPGRLALHASAAVFPEGAVLFCADSETGKSTLALALDALGVPVLGDDHVVVSAGPGGRPVAHPSVPWAEVGPRSLRRFRRGARSSRAAADAVVPLETERPAAGTPVAAVAFLRRGRAAGAAGFRRRAGRTALPRLLRGFAFAGDPGSALEQVGRFDLALRLVSSSVTASLTVPEGLARLEAWLPRLAPSVAALCAGPGPGPVAGARPTAPRHRSPPSPPPW